jgi:exopolysaccharide biosynthesis WecB/TagA/CpsF family protein
MSKFIKIKNKFEIADVDSGFLYSFINPVTFSLVSKDELIFNEIKFYSDGFLLSVIISILTRKKIKRSSFDFSSIAHDVFSYGSINNRRFYFIGADKRQVQAFVAKLKMRYPDINIAGYRDGYFKDDELSLIFDDINNKSVDILIASLGAVNQERFILLLKKSGYKGSAFTSGGFFRQESTSHGDYYPKIINRLNLRFLYRMLKEPHTIRRYLITYPLSIFGFVFNVFFKRIKLIIE